MSSVNYDFIMHKQIWAEKQTFICWHSTEKICLSGKGKQCGMVFLVGTRLRCRRCRYSSWL